MNKSFIIWHLWHFSWNKCNRFSCCSLLWTFGLEIKVSVTQQSFYYSEIINVINSLEIGGLFIHLTSLFTLYKVQTWRMEEKSQIIFHEMGEHQL